MISLMILIVYIIMSFMILTTQYIEKRGIEKSKKEIKMANEEFLNLTCMISDVTNTHSNDIITEDIMISFIRASNNVIMNRDEFNKYCDNIIKMHYVIYGRNTWNDKADIIKVRNIINKVLPDGICFIEHIDIADTFVVHLINEHARKSLQEQMRIYEMIYPEINCYSMRIIEDQFCTAFNFLINPNERLISGDIGYIKISSLLEYLDIPYKIESYGTIANEKYKIIKSD